MATTRPDTTTFAITADNLTQAVNLAITHLTEIVEQEDLRGFRAPALDNVNESFERINGHWKHVFRFTVELIHPQ